MRHEHQRRDIDIEDGNEHRSIQSQSDLDKSANKISSPTNLIRQSAGYYVLANLFGWAPKHLERIENIEMNPKVFGMSPIWSYGRTRVEQVGCLIGPKFDMAGAAFYSKNDASLFNSHG